MGNAETLWSENSGDKRIAYRGKECYLSKRIYFVGEEDGNSVFYLLLVPLLFPKRNGVNQIKLLSSILVRSPNSMLMDKWVFDTKGGLINSQALNACSSPLY